jgi:restriction system protein
MYLNMLLKQVGIRPPRSLWEFIRLLQHNLPQESLGSQQQKRIGGQMTWQQFERFLQWFFEQQGYLVQMTKKSHDQGADLILERTGERTVVQAKRTKGTVGNRAVQEVFAARGFYQANRALVITTSRFSKPAVDLANRLGVELWDWQRFLAELKNYQTSHTINYNKDKTIPF